MNNKMVFILQGVSGAGKTTWSKKYYPDAAWVNSNRFFYENEDSDEFIFDKYKLPEAHAQCFSDFSQDIAFGEEVIIVDNTNTTVTEVLRYMIPAQQAGYNVQIICIETNLEKALRRNKHHVPMYAIVRQAHNIDRFREDIKHDERFKNVPYHVLHM